MSIRRGAEKDLLHCLAECALNILEGNVNLKPRNKVRLTKYQEKLQKVADKRVSLKNTCKIAQTWGFALPLLVPVIAPLAKHAMEGGLLQGVLDKI